MTRHNTPGIGPNEEAHPTPLRTETSGRSNIDIFGRSNADTDDETTTHTSGQQSGTATSTFISRRTLLRTVSTTALGALGVTATSGTATAGGCTSFLDAPPDFPAISDGDTHGAFPKGSPAELLIYVHGWLEYFGGGGEDQGYTIRKALEDVSYTHPVVGYVYDSNNPIWWLATEDAEDAGHAFADWLRTYVDAHPSTAIRLVAHSLGARVTLTALDDLVDTGHSVASVALLGGAVDADEIGDDWERGIEHAGVRVDNFHSDEDDVLDTFYAAGEWEEAVGEDGAQERDPPSNYTDHDVSDVVYGHCEYFLPGNDCVKRLARTLD